MDDFHGVDDEVQTGHLELHPPQIQGHQGEEVGPCQLDTVGEPLQVQDMHKDLPLEVPFLQMVGRLQVGVLASQGNPEQETPPPGMALVEAEILVADDS